MLKKYFIHLVLLFFVNDAIASTNSQNTDTIICKGATIKLASPKIGLFSYKWSTGATTESIEVSPFQTTEYIVESVSATEIFTNTFKVIVDVPLPPPQISFVIDKLVSTYDPLLKIRWLKNNLIIPGSNNDTLKFPLQGVYRSEVSSLGGCWTSSQLLYVSQDTDTATIKYSATVFPNPNTGYFNLLLTLPRKVTKPIEILIQDINGTKIFESKSFIFQGAMVKIPVALPAGFKGQCVLKLMLNGIVTTQQIVIQ